jgi:hypothetical protein
VPSRPELSTPPPPSALPPTPRFDPTKAAEIRQFADFPKTIGRLYDYDEDSDGQVVGDLVYSGKTGPGTGGPGLTGRWKHLESLTEHTEGHAAAVMRQRRIGNAVLYLNRYPCPGQDGCFENIAAALRPGQRLTIWVVNADGSTVRVQRIGTGEAVEP